MVAVLAVEVTLRNVQATYRIQYTHTSPARKPIHEPAELITTLELSDSLSVHNICEVLRVGPCPDPDIKIPKSDTYLPPTLSEGGGSDFVAAPLVFSSKSQSETARNDYAAGWCSGELTRFMSRSSMESVDRGWWFGTPFDTPGAEVSFRTWVFGSVGMRTEAEANIFRECSLKRSYEHLVIAHPRPLSAWRPFKLYRSSAPPTI
jgi:hypothetical protein